MFDANMRYLPKGLKFFAKVWGVSQSLKDLGVKVDDILMCHMLNDGHDNPCVDITIKGRIISLDSDTDFYDNWLVYEGCQDGTGFIDKESKQIAMKLIEHKELK